MVVHDSLLLVAVAIGFLSVGCGAPRTPADGALGSTDRALQVVAEGPCPKLSMFALGPRRMLVYGDTGYDLRGWMPGDRLAAAQSIVELRDGRWGRSRSLLEGLPTNEGGYVPAEIVLGGASQEDGWLRLVTAEYGSPGRGGLFEREARGYRHHEGGWRAVPDELAVDMPRSAAALPLLDRDALCGGGGLRFVPLASAASPEGGLFVAGQCDNDGPVKHRETTLRVAHGRAGGTAWSVASLPETHDLDASVNMDIVARSDGEAYVSVVEPFTPRERRHGYLARYDGSGWQPVWLELGDGIMGLALSGDQILWAAAGRALYRSDGGAPFERVTLPALRFADARPDQLHVHTVRSYGPRELWVEASYRVAMPAADGRTVVPSWASALFGNASVSAPLYCDAQKPAEQAIFEVK